MRKVFQTADVEIMQEIQGDRVQRVFVFSLITIVPNKFEAGHFNPLTMTENLTTFLHRHFVSKVKPSNVSPVME